MSPTVIFLLKIMSLPRNTFCQTLIPFLAGVVLFSSCNAQTHNQRDLSMSTENERLQTDGHLVPCPGTPNCVNSEQHLGKSSIAPLKVYDSPAVSWQKIQRALQEEGGIIESVSDTFLHATFRSRIFRFVDDVTCRLDEENKMIHIRSASRIGYSDLGANRRRVVRIRKAYNRLLSI